MGYEFEEHKIWTWCQHSKVSSQRKVLKIEALFRNSTGHVKGPSENLECLVECVHTYTQPINIGVIKSFAENVELHWEREGEREGKRTSHLNLATFNSKYGKFSIFFYFSFRNTNLRSGKFCSFLKILNFFIHDPFIILKHLYPTKQCQSTPTLHQEICTLKYLYKKEKNLHSPNRPPQILYQSSYQIRRQIFQLFGGEVARRHLALWYVRQSYCTWGWGSRYLWCECLWKAVYHTMVRLWLIFQCSCRVSEVILIQIHLRTKYRYIYVQTHITTLAFTLSASSIVFT